MRAENELVGSLWEKALVRRDYSGSIALGSVASSDAKGKDDDKEKEEEKLKNADIGKIVSLVSTDAKAVAGAADALDVSVQSFRSVALLFLFSLSHRTNLNVRIDSWMNGGGAFFFLHSQRLWELPIFAIGACSLLYSLMGWSVPSPFSLLSLLSLEFWNTHPFVE